MGQGYELMSEPKRDKYGQFVAKRRTLWHFVGPLIILSAFFLLGWSMGRTDKNNYRFKCRTAWRILKENPEHGKEAFQVLDAD